MLAAVHHSNAVPTSSGTATTSATTVIAVDADAHHRSALKTTFSTTNHVSATASSPKYHPVLLTNSGASPTVNVFASKLKTARQVSTGTQADATVPEIGRAHV